MINLSLVTLHSVVMLNWC